MAVFSLGILIMDDKAYAGYVRSEMESVAEDASELMINDLRWAQAEIRTLIKDDLNEAGELILRLEADNLHLQEENAKLRNSPPRPPPVIPSGVTNHRSFSVLALPKCSVSRSVPLRLMCSLAREPSPHTTLLHLVSRQRSIHHYLVNEHACTCARISHKSIYASLTDCYLSANKKRNSAHHIYISNNIQLSCMSSRRCLPSR